MQVKVIKLRDKTAHQYENTIGKIGRVNNKYYILKGTFFYVEFDNNLFLPFYEDELEIQ